MTEIAFMLLILPLCVNFCTKSYSMNQIVIKNMDWVTCLKSKNKHRMTIWMDKT